MLEHNEKVASFVAQHDWVPYYAEDILDVPPKDLEWAKKHVVYKCSRCGLWIWGACK